MNGGMLLRKTVKKGIRQKDRKSAGFLPLGKKGRYGLSVCMAVALALCCFTTTALAAPTAPGGAADPLGVVNNLSSFIFSLIRAIGLILLGWGVVQVGLSFQSHDPSQRAQGFLTLAGGLIVTFAKESASVTC